MGKYFYTIIFGDINGMVDNSLSQFGLFVNLGQIGTFIRIICLQT